MFLLWNFLIHIFWDRKISELTDFWEAQESAASGHRAPATMDSRSNKRSVAGQVLDEQGRRRFHGGESCDPATTPYP